MQVRSRKDRPPEARSLEDGAVQLSVHEASLLKLRGRKDGAIELSPPEVNPLEPCSFEVGALELRLPQISVAEIAALQVERLSPNPSVGVDPPDCIPFRPTTANDVRDSQEVGSGRRILGWLLYGCLIASLLALLGNRFSRMFAQVGREDLDNRPVKVLRVLGDLLQRVDGTDPDVKVLVIRTELLDRRGEAIGYLPTAGHLQAGKVLASGLLEVEESDGAGDQGHQWREGAQQAQDG
jgi:hypothetical protein